MIQKRRSLMKKKMLLLAALFAATASLWGCGKNTTGETEEVSKTEDYEETDESLEVFER